MAMTLQTNTQIAPLEKICTSLTNATFKEKLAAALPPGLDVERFARTAVNAIQMHPQKERFNQCDHQTLFLAVQQAASDGVQIDGREATLTAFWNKDKNVYDITYMPMVQGLVKVARNSGEIASVEPHIVYSNDPFTFRPGKDSEPIFEPDWKTPPSERGEPILAYCVIRLKDETIISPEPLHRERILQIASKGNNFKQYDPDKGPHFAEWWKKTAVKNALKYAPRSAQLINMEMQSNQAEGFRFDNLRDVSVPEPKVSELFSSTPKSIEKQPEEVIPSEFISGKEAQQAYTESSQSEQMAPIEKDISYAYRCLLGELEKVETPEQAQALLNHKLLARVTANEVAKFNDAVNNKVFDLEIAAEDADLSAKGMFSK